jgi:hypothetical protein
MPLRSISRPAHILDFAAERFGGSHKLEEVTKCGNQTMNDNDCCLQVAAVKQVMRLVPFIFAIIPFDGIYSQMSTAFQNQVQQLQ